MFEYCGDRLLQGGLSPGDKNAMLETFLLHARCLYDFLYPPENVRADDVLADDFFSDSSDLRSKLPAALPISSYLKSRTGKEVAHLTYARLDVTPERKQWRIDDVHNQIGEALVVFFETLTNEKQLWFRKRYIR